MKYSFILKMVLRGWWRNKVFFLIAVISLSIGLAGTNLLLTYFIHDYFMERNNPDKERIFCLRQDNPFDDGQKVAFASVEAASDVQKKIPGVESFMQIQEYVSSVRYKGQTYSDLEMIGADSTLPTFFPVEVISGDLKDALTSPNKIAIRESVVKRIFGKEDPLGKTLETESEGKRTAYEVVAVMAEQTQSLLKYDVLTSKTADYWGGATFLKLLPNVSAEQVEKAIRADKSIQTMMPDRTQYYVDSLSALFCPVARNESATASVYPAEPGAVIIYRFAGCYFDLGDCLLQLYQYELEPADAAVKDDSCGETDGWNAS